MLSELLSFMPGIGAMDNLHPLFIHYPIALFTAFLLAEFLGLILKEERLRSAASFTLYFGNIATVVTVIAGYYAAATVGHNEVVHAIMNRHESFGLAVLIIATVLSVWRLIVRRRFSPKAQIIHLALAFILCVVVTLGADLGGLMVYKYGVGGQAVKIERASHKDAGPSHHEEAMSEQGGHGAHGGPGGHDHGE